MHFIRGLVLLISFSAFKANAMGWCKLTPYGPPAERTFAIIKEGKLNFEDFSGNYVVRKIVDSNVVADAVEYTYEYYTKKGKLLSTAETNALLARLNRYAITIAPHYLDVKISLDPIAHLQVRSFDDKSNHKPSYHPRWVELSSLHRFDYNTTFGRNLTAIRSKARADLVANRKALSKDRILAAMVLIMDQTRIRIGNNDAVGAEHFGLTTMKKSQIHESNRFQTVRMKVSNSGHELTVDFDLEIASVLELLKEQDGPLLFKTINDKGRAEPITKSDFNDYLKRITENDFDDKNFRAWWATVIAIDYLDGENVHTQEEKEAAWKDASQAVADYLNITRSQAVTSYIDPVVWKSFSKDFDSFKKLYGNRTRGRPSKHLELLEPSEQSALRILENLRDEAE